MVPDQVSTAQTPGRLLSVLGVSFGIAGAVGGTIGAATAGSSPMRRSQR
ncbi:hypothetical protein VB737_07550 [Synechococcus sp. BA-120 BA3]|nr:hypothetical protein [Synechococcus sp. BA-120 BA3]